MRSARKFLFTFDPEGSVVITTELRSGLSETVFEGVTQLSESDFIFDASTANDDVTGANGDDILYGGLGNDRLVGDNFSKGSGSDTFVLAAGEGTDTIVDFEVGVDLIGLADELSLGALTFEGSSILFEGETLAVLQGVDTTTLDESSFLSV